MIETLIKPVARAPVPTPADSCEVASLAEAARALRMLDRELALLRLEHQSLQNRFTKIRAAALTGLLVAAAGLALGLTALLVR